MYQEDSEISNWEVKQVFLVIILKDNQQAVKKISHIILILFWNLQMKVNYGFVLLRDSGRANKEVADEFLKEIYEISKIFASSILTLKGKR